MAQIFDQDFLKNQQYKTDANLRARMGIHARYSRNSYGWYRWLVDIMDLQAGARILDLGCGPGELWVSQARRLPAGARLCLCDLSHGMLRAAYQQFEPASGFRYSAGDAQAIPFQDAAFDLVTANHMLYHVPDLPRAVREIRRVLKPGGKVVAATNGLGHMQELHDLIRRVVPDYEPGDFSFNRFGLENGSRWFRGVFSEVTVQIYEDSLWITDVEPLVDYVRSMWGFQGWPQDVEDQMRAEITKEIQARGGFQVQKSSGVILAC